MHLGIYTLFTKFRKRPSLRLQLLARGLQWYGIGIAVVTVGVLLYKLGAPNSHITKPFGDVAAFKVILVGALQGASLIVIGRALQRLQRWSAYLAMVTLTAPIISRWGADYTLKSAEILVAVAAIGTLLTAWKELRSERDMDLVAEDEPGESNETVLIPKRVPGEQAFLAHPTREAYGERVRRNR